MEELKRKSIRYEVLTHESASEVVLVRITRQSDRKEHFGVNGTDEFVASNGLHLQSHCSPAVTEDIKEFGVFVRGEDHEDDDDVLVFRNREDFLMFKQAVREYNEYDFGAPKMSKAAIEKAKENIRIRVLDTIKELEDSLSDLKNAETEFHVLNIKRSIMLHLMDLPLTTECCPFCLHFNYPKENSDCANCEYGKKKGRCCEDDSTYNKILELKNELRHAIFDYPI